jgi:hypothetical protein
MVDKNNCCDIGTRKKKCVRKDGKVFNLPRRFTRKKCLTMKVRGFSMKSSCAPYKYCKRLRKTIKGGTNKEKRGKTMKNKRGKTMKNKRGKTRRRKEKGRDKGKSKKQFLFNPDDPSKSFDVYIDKNPNDTIPIKYKTLEDVRDTVHKLEKLYKAGKYTHKRIWQVGMIMYVRLKVYYDGKGIGKDRKVSQYNLAKRYFKFLGKRTKAVGDINRKKMKFNFN